MVNTEKVSNLFFYVWQNNFYQANTGLTRSKPVKEPRSSSSLNPSGLYNLKERKIEHTKKDEFHTKQFIFVFF